MKEQELESEEFIEPEWSHENLQNTGQNYTNQSHSDGQGMVTQSQIFDPGTSPSDLPRVSNDQADQEIPPESLPAFMALDWEVGALGVDMRPHVFDGVSKTWHLIDSGSQVTVIKPDPGDKVLPDLFLRAVNGTKIQCFGYKNISIRIGRKTYPFRAIKANVQCPVLGWDFMKRHKLNLIWNQWGDITINDRKAKISSVLSYKSVPIQKSSTHKKLRINAIHQEKTYTGEEANILAAQVEAIQELGTVKEDINAVPVGPYKDLLAKFPRILEQDFREGDSESKIIHRINTNDERPCRAKVRRLLPGSEKETKAKIPAA